MCNNDPMVSLAEKRILSEKLITLQHVHFSTSQRLQSSQTYWPTKGQNLGVRTYLCDCTWGVILWYTEVQFNGGQDTWRPRSLLTALISLAISKLGGGTSYTEGRTVCRHAPVLLRLSLRIFIGSHPHQLCKVYHTLDVWDWAVEALLLVLKGGSKTKITESVR